MRKFETGATRDVDHSKYDYEGFVSPYVMQAYGAYMHFNRHTVNGIRDSDNWQKGIPQDVYIKSGWRHFFDWWSEHRGIPTKEGIVWALCAVLFNVQGYLHEFLKRNPGALEKAIAAAEARRHKSWGKLNGVRKKK